MFASSHACIKFYRLRIAERPEPVVILLPGCIPQPQVDGLAVHHDVGAVVVEHRGDVLAREGVCRVGDEEAGFTCN